MINEHFFLKLPVNFQNKCVIYPPSVNDVISEENFNFYLKLLTISQEEIEDIYNEKGLDEIPMTPIEYLMASVYKNKKINLLAKKAFEFFIHEEVQFLYDQKIIIIGNIKDTLKNIKNIEELRIIDENDFFDFQNIIREAVGGKPVERPNPNEDLRVKKIKAKARYRDKIKAKRGMGLKLGPTLASICCMNFGLNPLNIGEISYASVPVLIQYYQEKEKYEIDIDSILAGADSKKIQPKYWIRNIED